ncbi:hypothetical protein ACNKHR_10265 [Shigella flexneri]
MQGSAAFWCVRLALFNDWREQRRRLPSGCDSTLSTIWLTVCAAGGRRGPDGAVRRRGRTTNANHRELVIVPTVERGL